jgi:hypothetical protein
MQRPTISAPVTTIEIPIDQGVRPLERASL